MNKSSRGLSPQASFALRRLLSWFETKFGTGQLPVDKSASVIVAESGRIEPHHLSSLLRHDAVALHVKNFYETSAATELAKRLDKEASTRAKNWKISTSRGLESSDVATLGSHAPYNVVAATKDPNAISEYFDGVWKDLHERRFVPSNNNSRESDMDGKNGTNGSIAPFLHPLDLLRLQLDDAWPGGAGLARDKASGRPFSSGLPRIMKGPTRWKNGLIHVDEMGPLKQDQGLFSANIYLQIPDNKNNKAQTSINNNTTTPQDVLRIWPVGVRSRWDWYRNASLLSSLSSQDVDDQARLRHVLTTQCDTQTIAVQPGDLILICAQRPHEAIGFASSTITRISLQCFIQHNGSDQRLLIDT